MSSTPEIDFVKETLGLLDAETQKLMGELMTHAVKAPKALRAGYGASDRQKKNNTAKSMICPDERPQEIYTNQATVDAIVGVWGRVAFDPCWGPGSIVPSETHAYVPPRIELRMRKDTKTGKKIPKPYTVFKAAHDEVDGLTARWPDFTYANPPFALLKGWLAKAVSEAGYGTEIMLLGPVRPHRKWWRAAELTCTKTCYLNPVKFVGHKSALPLPLAMHYWGERAGLFQAVFENAGLGECL